MTKSTKSKPQPDGEKKPRGGHAGGDRGRVGTEDGGPPGESRDESRRDDGGTDVGECYGEDA